jgi:glutamate racemase
MAEPHFIAVFDSGIGGLSILAEIRRLLPEVAVVTVADTAAFPYGDLPDEELIFRVEAIMDALTQVAPPDLAVIACNTASTIVLEPLRRKFSFPFVGCVPPVKPAGTLPRMNSVGASPRRDAIGLLATPATVGRAYTDALIRDFAGDSPVIRIGAPRLARLAEEALRGRPVPAGVIREELADFFDAQGHCLVDRVVLGCTHYPFLLPELTAALPAGVLWLDSGEAIARRVRQLLAEAPTSAPREAPLLAETALFTQEGDDLAALKPLLKDLGFKQSGVLSFPRGADVAGPLGTLTEIGT